MGNQNIPSGYRSGSEVGVAAVGGGGAGTLLVVLAQNLPDTYTWKSWLIIIAPAVSVTLSSFWIWVTKKFSKYRANRELITTIVQTREYLEKKIADPSIPIEMKKYYQEKLFVLEDKDFARRIKVIDA